MLEEPVPEEIETEGQWLSPGQPPLTIPDEHVEGWDVEIDEAGEDWKGANRYTLCYCNMYIRTTCWVTFSDPPAKQAFSEAEDYG